MGGFELDPEHIRTQGRALVGNAETFSGQVESFRSQIGGLEGAWGSDTIGMLIGTAYVAVAEWAFECLAAIAEDVSAAGDDLVRMAEGFTEVEESITAVFDRLAAALG